jgi:hypothetical protein
MQAPIFTIPVDLHAKGAATESRPYKSGAG